MPRISLELRKWILNYNQVQLVIFSEIINLKENLKILKCIGLNYIIFQPSIFQISNQLTFFKA